MNTYAHIIAAWYYSIIIDKLSQGKLSDENKNNFDQLVNQDSNKLKKIYVLAQQFTSVAKNQTVFSDYPLFFVFVQVLTGYNNEFNFYHFFTTVPLVISWEDVYDQFISILSIMSIEFIRVMSFSKPLASPEKKYFLF